MAQQPMKLNRLVLMMAMIAVVVIGITLFIMPQAEGENDAIVRGYAYEDGTGTELENVEVQLWGDPDGNSTQTNGTGYYEMGVPGGDYHLYGHKDGYQDQNNDFSLSNGTVFWYNFTMVPENAVIKGYVMEAESRGPIEDARINIWDGDEGGNGTNSDSSGYYEMYAPALYWWFWANADGYSSFSDQFDLIEYEEKWINITLKPMNSMIKGYVSEEDTRGPLEGVRVTSYEMEGGNESTTDASGYYEFWIFEGDFHFMTEYPGYYEYHEDISVGFEETIWKNISLREAPPETSLIRGYVMENDTRGPIEGASVDVNQDEYHKYNETDASGYYELQVPEGWFDFNVYKNGYKHFNDYFYVGDNDTVWMNVTLEDKPPENSVVRGYIYGDDDRGPLEAWVGLYDQQAEEGNQTGTDEDGYYEICASPANYIFYTGAEGYAQHYEEITIHDYEEIWINVTLQMLDAMIKGYIMDDTRAPLEDARIELDNHDAQMHYTAWTDEFGYYEQPLLSGDWNIQVNMDDYFQHWDEITIDEDEEFWYNATLEPAVIVIIEGFLLEEETGDPVVDEWINFNSERFGDGTWTDDQGYFMVMLAAGFWYEIDLDMPGGTDPGEIYVDDEDAWQNITYLLPPPFDVTIMGYLEGYETRAPLENAFVGSMNFTNDADIGTVTDDTGYFEFEAWSGMGGMFAMAQDHYTYFMVIEIPAGEFWYNITLYPVLENDATISGFVVDSHGEPVEDAQVLLVNAMSGIPIGDGDGMGFPYMTMTNDEGYYELEAPAGDWYLVIVENEENGSGIVQEVTVVEDAEINVTLPTALTNTQMTVEITDWDNMLFMSQGPFNFDGPASLTRLQVDFMMGDRDGTVSEEEALLFEAFLDIMMKEDGGDSGPDMDNTTDEFSVDGIIYDFLNESFTQTVTNLEGDVTSPEPVFITMTGDVQSRSAIPVADVHIILLNQSYPPDEDDPQESLTIILPAGFILESFIATENISVEGTGTDTIVVTSVGEPVEDGWEWITLTIMVPNVLPTVDAGVDQEVVVNTLVEFEANATDTDGTIVTYEWDFDTDGAFSADHTSTIADANFTYTTPGNYTVTVRVTDDRGGIRTDTLTVTVIPNVLPIVDAGEDQEVVVNTLVEFEANATDTDGTIVTYEWDFDTDGAFSADHTSTIADANFTYTTPGNYTVTVRVTDDRGGIRTDTLTVTVLAEYIPVPNLQIDALDLSNLDPDVDEVVEITVTLKNTGDADAQGIKVRVFIDDVLKDLLDVPDIAPNATITVSYNWTVDEGKHTIRINMTYTGGGDETERSITIKGESKGFLPGFELMMGVIALAAGALFVSWRRKD